MDENWQAFLSALKNPKPAYGSVTWDGQSKQISLTIQFARSGVQEDPEVIRERARRYFSLMAPEERAILEIEVHKRDGVPIWATIRPRSGAAVRLNTTRLRQLGQIPD